MRKQKLWVLREVSQAIRQMREQRSAKDCEYQNYNREYKYTGLDDTSKVEFYKKMGYS